MSPVQTAVLDNPVAGVLGGRVDDGPVDVVTRYSAAVIPFGRGVVRDTAGDKIKLPAASTDITNQGVRQGIAQKTQWLESVAGTDPAQYAISDPVNTLTKGRIWVWAEETIVITDTPFCRFTANGTGKDPGQFRKDADTGKAVAWPNARFLSVVTGAGLVQLELTLP